MQPYKIKKAFDSSRLLNDNLTLSGLLDKAACDLFSNMRRLKH